MVLPYFKYVLRNYLLDWSSYVPTSSSANISIALFPSSDIQWCTLLDNLAVFILLNIRNAKSGFKLFCDRFWRLVWYLRVKNRNAITYKLLRCRLSGRWPWNFPSGGIIFPLFRGCTYLCTYSLRVQNVSASYSYICTVVRAARYSRTQWSVVSPFLLVTTLSGTSDVYIRWRHQDRD